MIELAQQFLLQYWKQIAVGYAAFALLGHAVLWVMYLAVMNIKRAKDLDRGILNNKFVLYVGGAVLFVGYVLDFLLNVFVHTVLCLELPKETTISSRLKRYNRDPLEWAWRRNVAAFFEPLLDPFDPSGNHI